MNRRSPALVLNAVAVSGRLGLAPLIVVEISTAHLELGAQWRALTERAAANAFMNPAVTNAVLATRFAATQVLTAWDKTPSPAKLVGVWALRRTAVSPSVSTGSRC